MGPTSLYPVNLSGVNTPSTAYPNISYETTPFIMPASHPTTTTSPEPQLSMQSPTSLHSPAAISETGLSSPQPIPSPGLSVPMSSQLTAAQLEGVRSLMAAGLTGSDLTNLVRSMVEGEAQAGPSQPVEDAPPRYDFKDSRRR